MLYVVVEGLEEEGGVPLCDKDNEEGDLGLLLIAIGSVLVL
jgi:hypothetical protein